MKKHKIVTISTLLLIWIFLVFVLAGSVSAVVIRSVQVPELEPGGQGQIEVFIENTLSSDAEDVVISLDFHGLSFIPIGSSSAGFDELESGDDAKALFTIKIASDIKPGDYQIPYTITFTQNNEEKTRTGSIGIRVSAQPFLSFRINTENPITGQEGKINLKIVNSGFSDAKFVSVRAISNGFTILSEKEIYIGTVDSDDFETATFDVIFNSEKPSFYGIVDYLDFDNRKITQTVDIPMAVYSKEKAIELGILKRNQTPFYIGGAAALIILWLVWRAIKKRRRIKKSERSERR